MKMTAEEFRQRFAKGKGPEGKQSANILTEQVVRVARAYGVEAWRQNNLAPYDPRQGRFRKFNGRKGVADVIGILPDGKWFAAEVKAGRDTLSPEQRDFLNSVESSGGFAMCVRDIGEFEEKLRNYLHK
jgi:hypothetical protein